MSKRLAIKNGVLVTVDNDAVKRVFDVNNSGDTAVFDDVDTAKKVPNGATLFIQNKDSEAYKNSPAGLRYAVDHIVENSSDFIDSAEDSDAFTKHAPSLLAVKDYVESKLPGSTTMLNDVQTLKNKVATLEAHDTSNSESIDQLASKVTQLEENPPQSVTIDTAVPSSSSTDDTVPSSKAVYTAMSSAVSSLDRSLNSNINNAKSNILNGTSKFSKISFSKAGSLGITSISFDEETGTLYIS